MIQTKQTPRKNTGFETPNNDTKAIVQQSRGVQTKQIINQPKSKLEIQACHIYVSKCLCCSLILHLRGRVCGFALTFSTHESRDNKYMAHTHVHTLTQTHARMHTHTWNPMKAVRNTERSLSSGWPSGPRCCVQVAVSSGGVGLNPNSDNHFFSSFSASLCLEAIQQVRHQMNEGSSCRSHFI